MHPVALCSPRPAATPIERWYSTLSDGEGAAALPTGPPLLNRNEAAGRLVGSNR